MIDLVCEARLVAGEAGALEGGREALRALAEEAQSRGLVAIARRASSLAGG
jgi:hypothetical protein